MGTCQVTPVKLVRLCQIIDVKNGEIKEKADINGSTFRFESEGTTVVHEDREDGVRCWKWQNCSRSGQIDDVDD